MLLFRKSLSEARIPDDWREAHVTPIYKQKGRKSEPGNYRPVSLTSSVCKTLERLVKKGIEEFVKRSAKLSDSQHGFRRGRSPQTNLVEFLDTMTKWIDEGKPFDMIYLLPKSFRQSLPRKNNGEVKGDRDYRESRRMGRGLVERYKTESGGTRRDVKLGKDREQCASRDRTRRNTLQHLHR